ncbi:MAG: hypothetical protein NT062_28615 [Proteobacteria bacterium]|nr:hypothetical protein [Pseudomonadota bacterium]
MLALSTKPASSSPSVILADFRAELGALGAEVDRLQQDAGFRRALDTSAQFWRYSVCNQWLIQLASPRATRVAGRRVWEALGRKVRAGASPIHIIAPSRGRGFPFFTVEVFDVRQTHGRKLVVPDLILRGRTRQVAVLERAAAVLGIRVVPLLTSDGALGCSVGGEIRIRPGLPQREQVAVLSHELAHELLHQGDEARPRSVAEVETEADATSYVVVRALGLPSKAPSYIAWRGGSGALIARSLGRIQRAARRILDAGAVSA